MSIIREAIAEPSEDGERFDKVLADTFPEFSRAKIRRTIEWGGAYLDGLRVKIASRPVHAGQQLTLCLLERDEDYVLKDIPVRIVHQDEALLIVDKPYGLPSQGTREDDRNHLLRAVTDHVTRSLGLRAGSKVRLLHRLDWGTSGLLAFALTPAAYNLFLKPPSPRKLYLAVCSGQPPIWSGTIDAPIGAHPRMPGRHAVLPRGGKPSRTLYRVLRHIPGVSLIAAAPLTGRTHQIRLHLLHIGCPVLGDDFYGGLMALPSAGNAIPVPRMMLHAARLSFIHPLTKRRFAALSPAPSEMIDILDRAAGAGQRRS